MNDIVMNQVYTVSIIPKCWHIIHLLNVTFYRNGGPKCHVWCHSLASFSPD